MTLLLGTSIIMMVALPNGFSLTVVLVLVPVVLELLDLLYLTPQEALVLEQQRTLQSLERKHTHCSRLRLSHAAWVRLYSDTTSRTNDASRAYTTDPTPGSGVLAEVYTTTSGSNTFKMTPAVTGWNDDSTPTTNIYAKVTNNESSAQDITVSLTILRMED